MQDQVDQAQANDPVSAALEAAQELARNILSKDKPAEPVAVEPKVEVKPEPKVEVKEEPVVEPKAEEVPVDKFAEQFQRLSKQEKHISEQRKQIEEARKQFESEKALADEMKQLRELKSADPIAALERLGLSIEEINQALQLKSQPLDPLAKKVKYLEDQLLNDQRARQKAEESAHAARMEHAKATLTNEIHKTIESEGFDLIPTLNMQDQVIDYMEDMYKETGKVPSVKEACLEVTNYILDMYNKASTSKWVNKSKVESKPVQDTKSQTVSNKLAQSVIGADKPMTEAERLKAAANLWTTIRK